MLVKDIMITDPQALRPDHTLWEASDVMSANHLSAMPVIDGSGQLRGMVETIDLLPSLETMPFSSVEALKLLDDWVDEKNLQSFHQRYREVTVEEVMHWDVYVLNPMTR